MLTTPIIIFQLTKNGEKSEWLIVFVAHALLLFLTNAIFCIFGNAIPASFTKTQINKSNGLDYVPCPK